MMEKKLRLALVTKFGLIVFMFLMPFINVSCNGIFNATLSGMDLATGTTIEMKDPDGGLVEQKELDAQPLAAIALGAAILGLLIGFVRGKPARYANAIAGGVGALFLLLLKSDFDRQVMKEGDGMFTVNYEMGFWVAMLLFIAAIVAGIYAASVSPEA